MHSRIYVGNVRHHRFKPAINRFTYSIYLLYLDLDEVETIFDGNWLWSSRGFNFAWFREDDHLCTLRTRKNKSLKTLIHSFLAEQGIYCDGPVRLLTQVRYLGFGMNPASFFYCFDNHENLRAVVTQVNNTPWGEEHLYLAKATPKNEKSVGVDALKKDFHVSPFMPMDMTYDMRYSRPGEKLAIRMSNFQSNEKMLDVVMSMRRKKLTPMNLNWLIVTYPLMSIKVFAAIYWQALKLFWKKVPFFSHPRKQVSATTDRIEPQPTVQETLN